MAIRYWLQAARPRTLPLALSGALLGSLLASLQHRTNAAVTLLCAATAAALQIFGNLANDYGDARSGRIPRCGKGLNAWWLPAASAPRP